MYIFANIILYETENVNAVIFLQILIFTEEAGVSFGKGLKEELTLLMGLKPQKQIVGNQLQEKENYGINEKKLSDLEKKVGW